MRPCVLNLMYRLPHSQQALCFRGAAAYASVGLEQNMINSITKPLFEFLKLTPRYLIALGITAAFMLFSTESILKNLGIYDFAQNYRHWLSFVLILSSAILIVTVVIEITKWPKRWWRKRKFYNRMTERLNCLTENEKQILRFYIGQQSKTNTLRIDDGIVQGLESAGIIYRATSLGNMLEGFAYNISDFAWDYLNMNHHLLEGITNTCRTDKRRLW